MTIALGIAGVFFFIALIIIYGRLVQRIIGEKSASDGDRKPDS